MLRLTLRSACAVAFVQPLLVAWFRDQQTLTVSVLGLLQVYPRSPSHQVPHKRQTRCRLENGCKRAWLEYRVDVASYWVDDD